VKEKKMLWYGKCYSTSSSLCNIILVKFYILLTISWTQKVVIKLFYELWKKKEPHLKYFKVWGRLVKVNIPFDEKKSLVIYTDKFLETFLQMINWLNLFVIPLVLFCHLVIILFVSSYGNMSNFLRWLNDIY